MRAKLKSSRPSVPEIVSFLKTSPIRVAVFGEFNAGKSTFINAMMGEDILSVAIVPETAVPLYIRYGREFNIFVDMKGGKRQLLFEGEIPSWARFVGRGQVLNTLQRQQNLIRDFLRTWSSESERANEVSSISISLSLDWLKSGIELIDTPGVNNNFTQHQKYTEAVSKQADIAVILMDAHSGGGKRTEYEFLNVIQQRIGKVLVAINKIDLVDPDERDDILRYVVNEALPAHFEGAVFPPVYALSAKAALDGESEALAALKGEFAEFIKGLEMTIREERGRLLLHRLDQVDKNLFAEARRAEGKGDFKTAHSLYSDLVEILLAAELNQAPAIEGVARCETILLGEVTELDRINKEFNAAAEMEADRPDEALEYFERVEGHYINHKSVEEARQTREIIDRIAKRINKRDSARNEIKRIQIAVDKLKTTARLHSSR